MYMYIIASLRVLIVARILAAKAVKGGVFPTPSSIVSSVLHECCIKYCMLQV